MSDYEEPPLDPSDPETQFIPQEDDDETLWEVIEITAEKKNLYKVRWKGIDPKTQKPWPQSWVPKHDCTDDLVRNWKLRKAQKKKKVVSKREPGISKGSRGITSVKSSVSVSGSVPPSRKKKKLEMEVVISREHSAGGAEVDKRGTKRKVSNLAIASDDDDDDKGSRAISTVNKSVPPPRKKKKLEVEVVNSHEHSASSAEVDNKHTKGNGGSQVITSDDDDDYVGAKSKSDEEVDGRMAEESISAILLPRPPQEPTSNQEEGAPSSPVREQSPAYTRQDTAEESTPMVSRRQHATGREMDSLPAVLATTSSKPDPPSKKRSRPYYSPSSSESTETAAETAAILRNIIESASIPCPSSSSSSSSSSSVATDVMLLRMKEALSRLTPTTQRPKKRMRTGSLSKQDWEELNDFQSQQAADSGMVPGHDKSEKGTSEKIPELDSATNLNHPVTEERHPPPPSERSIPGQASRSRAVPAASSGSHSLSGRGTKSISPLISRPKGVGSPGPSATSPTRIVIPTTPLRKGSDSNVEEHGHRAPILSPRAKKRLLIFDRQVGLRKERQQLHDDDKAKKSKGRGVEEREDGEMVVAGGGRQEEHEFGRTSKEKSWNGRDKEQIKEVKARTTTPKPPEIKKSKNAEPSDASDSQDKPALKPNDSIGSQGSQGLEADLAVESNDIDIDTQMTGVVEPRLYTVQLRQEEEESTQDLELGLLLHQRQQGVGVGRSKDLVSEIINDTGDLLPAIQIDSQPISEAMLDTDVQKRGAGNNEKSDRILDEIPSIIVENPSRASLARSCSPVEDGDGVASRKTGSRTFKSRSRSRSVSSQRNKNDESDAEAVIPPTASTHRETLQESSQPFSQSSENPQYLGAAMHLLNIKSEEISKLEDQLSAEQRRNKDLLQQLSAHQLHLTEPTTNSIPSTTEALKQELAEARAQLALQTASWEIDRAALVLDIEKANRGKVSAENDRDFFQQQYAKASGFVSSVRFENTELENRIKIATDQAQSGVSLIKSTFELRIKSLEKDVQAWRRMAEFLVEKDRRTNDEIRRRAAEEPELRARCDRQEGALEDTAERLFQLEEDLEEKQKMLLEEQAIGKKWKEMTVKLNLQLNEALMKLERIGKVGIGDGDESAPNGHEFVYRCQWRPDDLNDACEAVFLNISELQEHLYTGGHLQP